MVEDSRADLVNLSAEGASFSGVGGQIEVGSPSIWDAFPNAMKIVGQSSETKSSEVSELAESTEFCGETIGQSESDAGPLPSGGREPSAVDVAQSSSSASSSSAAIIQLSTPSPPPPFHLPPPLVLLDPTLEEKLSSDAYEFRPPLYALPGHLNCADSVICVKQSRLLLHAGDMVMLKTFDDARTGQLLLIGRIVVPRRSSQSSLRTNVWAFVLVDGRVERVQPPSIVSVQCEKNNAVRRANWNAAFLANLSSIQKQQSHSPAKAPPASPAVMFDANPGAVSAELSGARPRATTLAAGTRRCSCTNVNSTVDNACIGCGLRPVSLAPAAGEASAGETSEEDTSPMFATASTARG